MGLVVPLERLTSIRNDARRQGKSVVFTNGVFDIIHRGHVEYLAKAGSLGDILIVGLNSDASVRGIKGDLRPIVAEDDRAFVLANLSPVDYVCIFNESTPDRIIRALIPDVLVKGADWKIDDIVGKDVVEGAGGRVATIDYIPERSTSGIIDRILQRFGPRVGTK